MNMTDWTLEPRLREFELGDYLGAAPRWCPSCGNHTVLKCLQKLCKDLNLPPEKTVVVSGIGCSSRLPHHMGTYGFHSLHGRALPVAEGIRARRHDLSIFVVTGDGDCCAIGAGHWIHALRYNMKMTVLLLDNNIYGLTKKQTSPTTPAQTRTNTVRPSSRSTPWRRRFRSSMPRLWRSAWTGFPNISITRCCAPRRILAWRLCAFASGVPIS